MKILVISDLHNDVVRTDEILRYYVENKFNDLFVLGDIGYLCVKSLNRFASSITAVLGNNDEYGPTVESADFPLPIVNYAYRFNKLFVLTHGHRYDEYNYSKPFDVMLLGHSHIKKIYRDYQGHIIANPGSITYPRDDTSSFMTIDEGGIKLHDFITKKVLDKVIF